MYSVSFTCPESRIDCNGVSKIMVWVTIDGERSTTYLDMKTRPSNFKQQLVSKKSNVVNTYCNRVRDYINEYIMYNPECRVKEVIEYIKNNFKVVNKVYTLNNLVEDYYTMVRGRANEITTRTIYRYKYTFDLLLGCIDGNTDVNKITQADIIKFRSYLINEYKYQTETLAGYLKRVKALFEFGFKNNNVSRNPFGDLKIKRENKEVIALTKEELRRIEKKVFTSDRLNSVKDCFLFSCYTALSYVDMSNLTESDIYDNGEVQYISLNRQKTRQKSIIPLSNKAIALLQKYDYKLPQISNQKTNEYLKEIADLCGIDKHLHFHIARHTALTLMLENNIPIEVVSKIAGHSNIRQTQHYAKVNENMVLKYASRV